MPNWKLFFPTEFEYDWENDKLAIHRITFDEAVEVFRNPHVIRSNKGYVDRWQAIGRTNGGRRLKIIFKHLSDRRARIITGWEI